jgi:hypothetical protein
MKTRRTNQPLELEDREDLERYIYGASPDDLTLEEMRDDAMQAYGGQIVANKHPSIPHNSNGDEQAFADRSFIGSFNKGLPRQSGGGAGSEFLPVDDEFLRFRRSTHTSNFFAGPDVPQLGPYNGTWRVANNDTGLRGWEAPESGQTLEPHGPDSHSVTMAAAPQLESDQLAFEIAEVYWLALLRDVPLTEFNDNPQGLTSGCGASNDATIADAVADLNAMAYAIGGFKEAAAEAAGIYSRSRQTDENGALTPGNIFRGATPGDLRGPYLSQFMLLGAPQPAGGAQAASIPAIRSGKIGYGAQTISQKFQPHLACLDHMTDRQSFLDVQEGARVGGNLFESGARFITTPRDMATYVHYDALYQAYLNACLMLLGFRAPVDPGIAAHNNLNAPVGSDLRNVTEGFALFGGPHVLNLVTEVATRALKAVRYQKFNVHCRLRPEAVGGVIEFNPHGVGAALQGKLSANLQTRVRAWNRFQNSQANFNQRTGLDATKVTGAGIVDEESLLLPMAFSEGSPMHPAYGAGHATVAGACVTMLKAFFDTDAVFVRDRQPAPDAIRIIPRADYEADTTRYKPISYVASANGASLTQFNLDEPLTVGDELNKLAANISIARNMAGVHFYTDYIDSLIMGEEVAIRTLSESFSAFPFYPLAVRPNLTIPKFLGGHERIG